MKPGILKRLGANLEMVKAYLIATNCFKIIFVKEKKTSVQWRLIAIVADLYTNMAVCLHDIRYRGYPLIVKNTQNKMHNKQP